MTDLQDDFTTLGVKLQATVVALKDPEMKASGSDAAALARTRRLMGAKATDDRAGQLRSDYDLLSEALEWSTGSGAAAVANERRMIRQLLASIEKPEGLAKVDELASFRRARTEAAGTASRRRKSG